LAENRTKLQRMLGADGITIAAVTVTIGAKQPKTASQKVHGRVAFTLPEMRAIQKNYYPHMTLDEIFEGY